MIRKVRASKGHRKRKQRIRKVSSWKMAVELNFKNAYSISHSLFHLMSVKTQCDVWSKNDCIIIITVFQVKTNIDLKWLVYIGVNRVLPRWQYPMQETFDPDPGRRKRHLTPASFPRESHGQRSVVGYRAGHDWGSEQWKHVQLNHFPYSRN